MTRFGRRYRVRAGLTKEQYNRAAGMLLAEVSRAVQVPLPICADEIIPLMVAEFGSESTYLNRDRDPLHDFAALYLTELPYMFEDAFPRAFPRADK